MGRRIDAEPRQTRGARLRAQAFNPAPRATGCQMPGTAPWRSETGCQVNSSGKGA